MYHLTVAIAHTIAVSAILAATHGGKNELSTVFLAEWTVLFFMKTAIEGLQDSL